MSAPSIKGLLFGGGMLSDDDLNAINRNAQMQQALALLAASGPSAMPTNFGQVLLAGNAARDESVNKGMESALAQQKIMAEREQRKKMQSISGMFAQGEPTPERAKQILLAAIETGDPALVEYARKLKDMLVPSFKTQSVQELMIDGKPKKFAVGEDGSMRELGVSPEKLMKVDAGGQILLVSESTGKTLSQFGVSMTPSEAANLRVAQGNLSVAQDNLALRKKEIENQRLQGKVLPEGVMNAQGYADRMLNAEQILKKAVSPGAASMVLRGVPGAGDLLANAANSPKEQQYYQAAQDWIRAKLRKESGAAIGVDEMAQEYRTYFPQIGDSKEVLEQKELAREQAALGMIRSGGPTYQPNLLGVPENLKQNKTSEKVIDFNSLPKSR